MVVRAGRYELLQTIASGGMAKVHLGRVIGVGGFERLVAVKVMHAHLSEEPEFVAMFLDEARLAARIHHPNVVGTIDIQHDTEGYLLVMEYVEGPSLHRVVKALTEREAGPIPTGVALRIFIDALAGLHAAHELQGPEGELLNVVHRDVSPHNILIGVDGVARLTDFGIARAESRLHATRTGEVKGKVAYMSPEQIRSEQVDRRTDIYAAGVVLWEMLTGTRLVVVSDDGSMLDRILGAKHRSPRDARPSVPEALSQACMTALAGLAADRPATAAMFSDALEAAAAKDGVTIASPRAVAAFIKELGLADLKPVASAGTSSASVFVAGVASEPTRAVRAETAAPAPRGSGIESSTDTAVNGPQRDSGHRSSALPRWLGPSVLAAIVTAVVVAVTRPPSPSAKGAAAASDTQAVAPAKAPLAATSDPRPATAESGSGSSSASATADASSSSRPAVMPAPSVTPAGTPASAATAPPATAAPPTSKRRVETNNGGTFRPRDL